MPANSAPASQPRAFTPAIRQWLITLAALGAGAGVAATAERFGSNECATRDLKLVKLIEQHRAAHDISSERVAEASLAMIKARNACRDGRVSDAVAIYDGVLLAPGFARAKQ